MGNGNIMVINQSTNQAPLPTAPPPTGHIIMYNPTPGYNPTWATQATPVYQPPNIYTSTYW